MNRIFGLLTQWGLRLSLERLRAPNAMELLAARGVEETWRRSIAEALAVIDLLDERIAPLRAELAPFAAADLRWKDLPELREIFVAARDEGRIPDVPSDAALCEMLKEGAIIAFTGALSGTIAAEDGQSVAEAPGARRARTSHEALSTVPLSGDCASELT